MEQPNRLELLKEILLAEEKDITQSLVDKVEKLSYTLNQPRALAEKVDPLVDDKINTLVQDMPQKLSPVITQALKTEIQNSQDAVVEALFPIIGKMIKKYVSHEIKLLNDKVNAQLQEMFTFKNLMQRFFGKKPNGVDIINSATAASLIQVLVIEKNSGVLIANHAPNQQEGVDEDLVAGMLTAIKSFVEDAFKGGDQELETLAYELYTLHIQNFYNYYIVAVVSGVYTIITKEKLENLLLNFAEKGISKKELQDNELFTNKLKSFFSDQTI